jgi:hypothetical protein
MWRLAHSVVRAWNSGTSSRRMVLELTINNDLLNNTTRRTQPHLSQTKDVRSGKRRVRELPLKLKHDNL